MSSSGASFRGQPLLLLGLLLIGWIGLRTIFWRSPLLDAETPAIAAGEPILSQVGRNAQPSRRQPERAAGREADRSSRSAPQRGEWLVRPLPPAIPDGGAWQQAPLLAPIPSARPSAPRSPAISPQTGRGEERSADAAPYPRASAAIGHNLLLLAGLSQMELPEALVAALRSGSGPGPGPGPGPNPTPGRALAYAGAIEAAPAPAGLVPLRRADARSRWSADGWLLLRRDNDGFTGASAYGRSQAGAVLRYRLAPASRHAPQAHLRGALALDDAGNDLRESEVATGLSARPIPALPVRVAAELRVSETSTGTRVRPAVYAVTELPPVALPLGTRGELYLQGGYVADEVFDSAFIDGQARIDRPLARLGGTEVTVGAAAWCGAQRQASRLDVGPSAGVAVGLGRVRARLSADYRFRIAGESRPDSGPALTLSAGF